MKILFFPFAGGSSYSYVPFSKALQGRQEITAIELPGRGRRIAEPLLNSMDALVEDVLVHHEQSLHAPYAIFGHSMGALLGFLFAHKVMDAGLRPPAHLFLSGRGGPSLERQYKMRHQMPREQFIRELIQIGGISEEVASNEEILSFAEPILRADFTACETYIHQKRAPLDIPISVMVGREEETSLENVMYWQRESLHKVKVYPFPGDHFFLFRHVAEIGNILTATLQNQEQRLGRRA
jgi:surfactin synthase thioesterase subunit